MVDPIKVLLVDDDTLLGDMVSSALTENGYIVHFQNSLTGIISAIREFNPSILVFDVEIGEEDGINCAKEIFASFPSIPVLFISSHTEIESVTRGIRAGGVGYLRKPFEMEELKALIDRFALPRKKIKGIPIGDNYSLHTETKKLFYQSTPVKQLSPHEFMTLRMLVQNRDEILSYNTLSKKVWGKDYSQTENSMNNLISRLRKLLANDSKVNILTIKQRVQIDLVIFNTPAGIILCR